MWGGVGHLFGRKGRTVSVQLVATLFALAYGLDYAWELQGFSGGGVGECDGRVVGGVRNFSVLFALLCTVHVGDEVFVFCRGLHGEAILHRGEVDPQAGGREGRGGRGGRGAAVSRPAAEIVGRDCRPR
jgi:hypothetical protein